MLADSSSYEYQLDNQFFADLDSFEIQKGKLNVFLSVRRGSGIYQLDFQINGHVVVTCDRCLDEMEQPIECCETLKVKFGSEYTEIDDLVVVPEEDGYINVAWFIYEFISLNIPMKHVHPSGKCNNLVSKKLGKLLRTSSNDEDLSEDDFMSEVADDSSVDEERAIDPRWNELKKIFDNN